MRLKSDLYNTTFLLGFAYNFFMALNFTNNAVYPLYVKEMGGTAKTVGLFMGVASLSAVLARPLIGWMIDRFGVKPVLLLGSLAMSLPSIGYWLLLSQGLSGAVWALRLVHGFGFGAHFSAFFTLAAQAAPKSRRNEAIAMFGFSGLLANLVGPFFGELVFDHFGLPAFFWLVTGFGLTAFVIISFLHLEPQPGERATPTFTGALHLIVARNLRFVFLLALLLSISFSSQQFFIAPLARDRGIANFGLYFTGYAVAGMTVRFIGRGWGDKYGVRRVLIPAFFMYASGMFLIHLSNTTAMLALAGALSGSAHGLAFPAVNALGYNRAPTAYAGSVIALLTGWMDGGGVLTAVLFGQAAELWGYNVVFPLATLAGLAAAISITVNVILRPVRVPAARG